MTKTLGERIEALRDPGKWVIGSVAEALAIIDELKADARPKGGQQVGPMYQESRLKLKKRIAELEAEVERLQDTIDGMKTKIKYGSGSTSGFKGGDSCLRVVTTARPSTTK